MNKYIYKVRFVTLKFIAITRTKMMHKHVMICILANYKQFNYNFNDRKN